jgi:hypothetical protein
VPKEEEEEEGRKVENESHTGLCSSSLVTNVLPIPLPPREQLCNYCSSKHTFMTCPLAPAVGQRVPWATALSDETSASSPAEHSAGPLIDKNTPKFIKSQVLRLAPSQVEMPVGSDASTRPSSKRRSSALRASTKEMFA